MSLWHGRSSLAMLLSGVESWCKKQNNFLTCGATTLCMQFLAFVMFSQHKPTRSSYDRYSTVHLKYCTLESVAVLLGAWPCDLVLFGAFLLTVKLFWYSWTCER